MQLQHYKCMVAFKQLYSVSAFFFSFKEAKRQYFILCLVVMRGLDNTWARVFQCVRLLCDYETGLSMRCSVPSAV